MNTIRSTWYGWGALIIAGGSAYYFAKKSINADRAEKHRMNLERRQLQDSIEARDRTRQAASAGFNLRHQDTTGSPSAEGSSDPAATRHAPAEDTPRGPEKSKFEASEPYRPRKGNRLS